jgi:hypothetical protein
MIVHEQRSLEEEGSIWVWKERSEFCDQRRSGGEDVRGRMLRNSNSQRDMIAERCTTGSRREHAQATNEEKMSHSDGRCQGRIGGADINPSILLINGKIQSQNEGIRPTTVLIKENQTRIYYGRGKLVIHPFTKKQASFLAPSNGRSMRSSFESYNFRWQMSVHMS